MEEEVGTAAGNPDPSGEAGKTKAEIKKEMGSRKGSGPPPEKAAPLPWENLKK